MKKIIAVVPLWDDEKQSLWMLPNYLDAIRESGGVPLVLPLHVEAQDAVQILTKCDGLLITGGHDVDPAVYGQEKLPLCGALCPSRDRLEKALYRYALNRDMPVLGICRGLQTVNVLQGGSLYQDLPAQCPSQVEHHGLPPYHQVIHDVSLADGLRQLLGLERLGVNSYHHQAIRELGRDLQVMAQADDGIVEAVRHKGKRFVWAVQWHPEFSFRADENSRKIFKAFVDAC